MPTLIDAALCREWRACYSNARLAELFDRPHTLLEVLTRRDGPWERVSGEHRVWVAMQSLGNRDRRLFACECAEAVIRQESAAGRPTAPTSAEAVAVARRFASVAATDEELRDARHAAERTYNSDRAAFVAAWSCSASSRLAGLITSDYAAGEEDAGVAVERSRQVEFLISLLA